MRKLSVIIAAAATLCAFPALAGSSSEMGSSSSPGMSNGNMKGDMGERRSYGYDREHERDTRRFGTERGQAMREGCKYITVKQRHGDEITIRKFKRCD